MGSGFGISQSGLLASIWVLTAAATCLTIGRIGLRCVLLDRLYWDDFFHVAAYLLLLGQSIAYTYFIPKNYHLLSIEAGTSPQPSADQFSALVSAIYKAEFAIPLLFWTCLFSVKFSFLWLYRLILSGSGVSLKIWWSANFAVLLAYGIILIGVFAECGPAQNLFKPDKCSSDYAVALDYRLLPMQYTFNVVTDLLVIALPLPTLWKLQMRTSQKVAVTTLFSIALVIIAFDTLRIVETFHAVPSVTWLYTSLETEMAVIVCSLPSYRFLLSDSANSKSQRRTIRKKISRNLQSSNTGSRLDSSDNNETLVDGESFRDGVTYQMHAPSDIIPAKIHPIV